MSSHFVDVWTLRWHALHCSTYIIDTNEFADSGPLRLKTRAAPRERKLRQYRCNDAICWLNICRIKCLICSVASWWMTIYRKNSYHPVLKQWKTDLTSTSGPGTTQKLITSRKSPLPTPTMFGRRPSSRWWVPPAQCSQTERATTLLRQPCRAE